MPLQLDPRPVGDTSTCITVPGVSRLEFMNLLANDVSARARFTEALAGMPYAAFCLELPPLSAANGGRPAEFVVVDSRLLRRTLPDPAPFAGPLAAQDGDVVVFRNLGGDAELVVPQPSAAPGSTHLAVFLRTTRPAVIDLLWRRVAETTLARLGPEPLWVSTAGLGVAWLHVRLDRVPKYYRHAPYRDPGA